MEKVLSIFKSKYFKIFAITLSIIFFISTFFIKFDSSVFQTWGYFGIFIFNVFSSGILLIPKLINQVDPILFTLASAFGMTLNESINWYMGFLSNDFIKESEKEKKFEHIIEKYELFAIFFFALIPFPFDIIGTISGRLNIPFLRFLITILSARIIRFALIIWSITTLTN